MAFDAFWQGPLVDRKFGRVRRMSPAAVGDTRRGDPTGWVIGGPGQYPIDALLTVAADSPSMLDFAATNERSRAVACGLTVVAWQDCQRLQRSGHGIEPFGFRNGISQPGIRGFTAAKVRNKRLEAADQPGTPIISVGEFVLGYDGEGGSNLGVQRSRPPDWMHDGSFHVFLRLRQDVNGWKTKMAELSELFTIDAATTAVGRTPEGEALAAPGRGEAINDFTFETDLLGTQTPRFAHIRKMNPRNGSSPGDRIHRLLRRGIPFATPLHIETTSPDQNDIAPEEAQRGLAFSAFMASIENQFEFLQQNWASNPDSLPPVAADGPDPLVGASDAPGLLRRPGGEVQIPFGRFVWTSGAVYAFAPSLSTLRQLAGLRST